MGESQQVASSSMDDLRQLIRTCPIIDNHGHNILRPDLLKAANLLTATSEASGEAFKDVQTSLSHLRAAKQLRKLYSLPSSAAWSDIRTRRLELLKDDPHTLFKTCFSGTQTILIDDGLDSGENVHPYNWHDQYTSSPCKRIVRIEAVAADCFRAMYQEGSLPIEALLHKQSSCSTAWDVFMDRFDRCIQNAISDPEVVGFKSVICYRTGLDICLCSPEEVNRQGIESFEKEFLESALSHDFRIEAKGMNDALVINLCHQISMKSNTDHGAKPLQFHTGLGDNDISLLKSDPAYLQPLIREFPTVPIVLLHSSWPYTRQAGYLATVYANCYLDLGEVFPMVSRRGQEGILRQALEVTPWSKLLWSTDGHFLPETYWLANIQMREAFDKVLGEIVNDGDLSVDEAMAAVRGILWGNSNKLYNLGLEMRNSPSSLLPEKQAVNELGVQPGQGIHNRSLLNSFMEAHPETEYFVVQWLDFLGTIRSRWFPKDEFSKLVDNGTRISISLGNLGTTQNDHFTPVVNPVGQILVEPDLSSLRPMQQDPRTRTPEVLSNPPLASIMASFTEPSGSPHPLCPRAELQRITSHYSQNHSLSILLGFEIEITFLHNPSSQTEEPFKPLDTHSWASLTSTQYNLSTPLLFALSTALAKIDITPQYMHSEAGPGQYEFVLAPRPPVAAIDALYQARQCLQQLSAVHGLRATCHPTPFEGIGTAAHAHVSLHSSTPEEHSIEGMEAVQESFVAGILGSLPALCALCMPQKESYGRVVADGWTGGLWVGWGVENRETPLRRVGGEGKRRWEVRCLDGFANMYLAMAAVLTVGLEGIGKKQTLGFGDCRENPSQLTERQRRDLGMTVPMPRSLGEALMALAKDEVVEKALSAGLIRHYLTMKSSEQEMLDAMTDQERRMFLIERY